MTIHKFGDSHADILLQCSLRSSAALTAAGITLAGTATVDSQGLDTGTAGSASISALAGYLDMADSFQISITVTTIAAAEYDDSSSVSFSAGVDRSAAAYLLSWERQNGTDEGRIFVSAAEQLTMRTHAADAQTSGFITSIGKGEVTTLTVAGDNTYYYIYADGERIHRNSRTAGWGADIFYKLIIGASWNGTATPFGTGYKITDLVVAKNAPILTIDRRYSFDVFGDSFAQAALAVAQTPRFDASLGFELVRLFRKAGINIEVTGEGFGGFSVCDTGASDLNDEWSDWRAFYNTNKNVLIMALNNDVTSTDAQVTNATTGTYARLYSWLDDCLSDGRSNVFISTPGSLSGNTSINTAGNNTRRKLVDSELRRCVADWKAANGTQMRVIIVNLFAVLGNDVANNLAYQGRLNEIGNVTTGAGTLDDRHPSAYGHVLLARETFAQTISPAEGFAIFDNLNNDVAFNAIFKR